MQFGLQHTNVRSQANRLFETALRVASVRASGIAWVLKKKCMSQAFAALRGCAIIRINSLLATAQCIASV